MHVFFSHTAIVPVHENLILIAYAIIPKVISIILPLMAKTSLIKYDQIKNVHSPTTEVKARHRHIEV